MSAPRAVQQQAERAEQLRKEHYGETDLAPENEAEVEEQASEEPVEPDRPEPEAPETNEPDWKQKFLTLDGKYRSEVPRLHQQIREQDQQLGRLRSDIDTLKQAQQPPERLPDDLEKQMREFEEEFGPGHLNTLRSIAESMISKRFKSELEPLKERFQSEVEPLRDRVQKSDEQRFWDDLKRDVPNWQDTNQDQAFHDWLNVVDPIAGEARQTLLERAQQTLNAERVTALFKAFDSHQQQRDAAQNDPKAQRRTEALERQLSPGRSRSRQAPEEAPKYTVNDWTQLQDDARRGEYVGRDEEFRRKEAEIHAAIFG